MTVIKLVCLSLLLAVTVQVQGFRFPTLDEDPLIATVESDRRLYIINTTRGSRTKRITLNGTRRSVTCALDYSYERNLIYWSDIITNKIHSLSIDSGEQRVVYAGYMRSPEGLGYDWIYDNLYIADWLRDKIILFKPETEYIKDLIDVKLPREVKPDPKHGWLYYTSDSPARIYRSSLDGQNQEDFVTSISMPMSIAIDFTENRLYWTDDDQIVSKSLNGGDTTRFYHTNYFSFSPYHLTVTMDTVYWNTFDEGRVRFRKKARNSTTRRYTSVGGGSSVLFAIIAIHPSQRPVVANLCGNDNGGCSHFCLPADVVSTATVKCHCPNGMAISNDNKTCETGV